MAARNLTFGANDDAARNPSRRVLVIPSSLVDGSVWTRIRTRARTRTRTRARLFRPFAAMSISVINQQVATRRWRCGGSCTSTSTSATGRGSGSRSSSTSTRSRVVVYTTTTLSTLLVLLATSGGGSGVGAVAAAPTPSTAASSSSSSTSSIVANDVSGGRNDARVVINEIMYNERRNDKKKKKKKNKEKKKKKNQKSNMMKSQEELSDLSDLEAPASAPIASIDARDMADDDDEDDVEVVEETPQTVLGGDWVELLNAGDEPVDVTGWTFRGWRNRRREGIIGLDDVDDTADDEEEEDVFTISPPTSSPPRTGEDSDDGVVVIPAGGYLVLARNVTKFADRYPMLFTAVATAADRDDVVVVNASFGFNLSPKGELLTLRDAAGRLVEAVEYGDDDPWPREPDGRGGYTLELIHPDLDRNNAFSWLASDSPGGTPGAPNSVSGGGGGGGD